MRASVTGSRGLIVVIVLFCLLLNALIWYDLQQSHQQEREATIKAAVQRNDNLCIALEQYTIRTIQNADAVLQLLQMEYEKEGLNIDFDQISDQPFFKNSSNKSCAIIDVQGNMVAGTMPMHPDSSINFSDRPYFKVQQELTGDSLYISAPFMSRTIHQPVIALSRPLRDAHGRFLGVVALQIAPSNFTHMYAGARQRPGDIISLIAPDGITYARRTGSLDSHGENISKSPLFQYLTKSATGAYLAKDALHQIPTYFSYRKLVNYPIIATVGVAESDVLAGYNASVVSDYKKTGLISLLICLFSVLLMLMILFRKKSLQKLKESELKYRSIFENSHDAILLMAANGAIIDLNEAACRIFKINPAERENLRFSSLLATSATAHQYILPAGGFHLDVPFCTTAGTTFPGEMATASYKDSSSFEMIIAVIRDLTERKEMEKKLALEKKRRQRLVTKHIIVGQEREREAIGRELHDNINQVLTSAKLYLEMALHASVERELLIPKCQQLIEASINDIRNLSHNLSAPTLGTRSLVDAINALLETVGASSGLSIQFRHQTYQEDIDLDIKLAIYRIIQEQVNNVIKHAHATEIIIKLQHQDHQLKLEIVDDGAGFDPAEGRKGIGFNNIESRVKVFDGHVKIVSAPGQGCQLQVRFPLVKIQRTPPLSAASMPHQTFDADK